MPIAWWAFLVIGIGAEAGWDGIFVWDHVAFAWVCPQKIRG